MESEAEALLAKRPASHKLICLDRGGSQLGSEGFARVLAKYRDEGAQGVAFFIGGADGLGLSASFKADLVLSLGSMTLPHGLARIVLAEQIYRAMTILSGHPYHRA
jgi:23S rRNA (pseudouridine1915-N3)-methyltransferase